MMMNKKNIINFLAGVSLILVSSQAYGGRQATSGADSSTLEIENEESVENIASKILDRLTDVDKTKKEALSSLINGELNKSRNTASDFKINKVIISPDGSQVRFEGTSANKKSSKFFTSQPNNSTFERVRRGNFSESKNLHTFQVSRSASSGTRSQAINVMVQPAASSPVSDRGSQSQMAAPVSIASEPMGSGANTKQGGLGLTLKVTSDGPAQTELIVGSVTNLPRGNTIVITSGASGSSQPKASPPSTTTPAGQPKAKNKLEPTMQEKTKLIQSGQAAMGSKSEVSKPKKKSEEN